MRLKFTKQHGKSLGYVTKKNLQVIGLTAFVIASKYEEVTFPILDDWRYLSDHSVSCEEIKNAELEILQVLNFKVNLPVPLTFLRRFSNIAKADARQHRMARFFLESMFYCIQLSKFTPSHKAATAIYLSLKLTNSSLYSENSVWTKELEYYSRVSEKSLQESTRLLCYVIVKVVKSCCEDSNQMFTKSANK